MSSTELEDLLIRSRDEYIFLCQLSSFEIITNRYVENLVDFLLNKIRFFKIKQNHIFNIKTVGNIALFCKARSHLEQRLQRRGRCQKENGKLASAFENI